MLLFAYVCVQRKCAERDGLRAVCKATSVKAPGSGGFTDVALHAALSLAQHHSAWWPESAWLTSFYNDRNPGNNSLSGAEFCSLKVLVFMRLWRAKRRQTAFTQNPTNPYAGHKRQQKSSPQHMLQAAQQYPIMVLLQTQYPAEHQQLHHAENRTANDRSPSQKPAITHSRSSVRFV